VAESSEGAMQNMLLLGEPLLMTENYGRISYSLSAVAHPPCGRPQCRQNHTPFSIKLATGSDVGSQLQVWRP